MIIIVCLFSGITFIISCFSLALHKTKHERWHAGDVCHSLERSSPALSFGEALCEQPEPLGPEAQWLGYWGPCARRRVLGTLTVLWADRDMGRGVLGIGGHSAGGDA